MSAAIAFPQAEARGSQSEASPRLRTATQQRFSGVAAFWATRGPSTSLRFGRDDG